MILELILYTKWKLKFLCGTDCWTENISNQQIYISLIHSFGREQILTIVFQFSKPQWTLIVAYFLGEYKPQWLFQSEFRIKQFHITFYELCTWISVLICNKNLKHSELIKIIFFPCKLEICNSYRLSTSLTLSKKFHTVLERGLV